MRELKELALPETLDELWEKKAQYGSRAVVIAGGTELVAASNAPPSRHPADDVECLIDIRHLGLDRIGESESFVTIGATATMDSLAQSPVVASLAQGMLCQSSCQGWPAPVRSAATIGGNLAGGDPFADTPAALLALGAQVILQTPDGPVTLSLEDFFLDYRRTAAEDVVLSEIRVPKTPVEGRGAFLKCAPGSIDKAMINLGVYLEIVDGRCRKVRVAVGAVTRIPHRLAEVEALMTDRALEIDLIEEAAEVVARSVDPMLDIRASVEKRRGLLSLLFKRAAHQMARPAQS